jgi:hypothetical protein
MNTKDYEKSKTEAALNCLNNNRTLPLKLYAEIVYLGAMNDINRKSEITRSVATAKSYADQLIKQEDQIADCLFNAYDLRKRLTASVKDTELKPDLTGYTIGEAIDDIIASLEPLC